MPKIEGRNLTRPRCGEVMVGNRLILRVDDKAHPDFWLTVSFAPAELTETLRRWVSWLSAIGHGEAARALVESMAAALVDAERH